MFKIARRKLADRMLRFSPVRTARRFVRQQDGAAAIEFSFIAVPFLALLFAILETALVFFAGQTLEAAAADSARLIMTGQAQTTGYNGGSVPYTANDFKSAVCGKLAGGLFDCTSLTVDVQTYTDFTSVSTTPPVNSGNFDATRTGYATGTPGCIVSVALYYQWRVYLSLLDSGLSNLNGGNRLLVATAVFRNEPYGTPGACTPHA
jgi:Flp pilus assembly protein TadG